MRSTASPPVKSDWYSPVEGQFVIKSYWKGFKAGVKQFYPCPALRLVNAETGEVVEEVNGNGKVII